MPELGVVASSQVSVPAPGGEANQDALGRWAPEMPAERARAGALFLVADGLGPGEAGRLASQTAIDTALAVYRREYDGSVATSLERAFRAANRAVQDFAGGATARGGVATTCTAAVVHGGRLYLAHVGDSRAYLVRQGHARQLTHDHTWAGERLAEQRLNPEEAQRHPLRYAPTRLLGAEREVQVDMVDEWLHDGDVVVLCTDGLSAKLNEATIAHLVQADDPRGAAERLALEARKAGSTDDVTAVVLAIEPVVGPSGTIQPRAPEPVHPEAPASTEARRVLLMGAATISLAGGLFLLGAIGLYQLTYRDRAYPGIRTLGVDLGGRGAAEIARAVDLQFAEYARQALTLEAGDQQYYLTPAELGVRIDANATAEGALRIGRSGNLLRQLAEQIRGLVSGRDAPLVFQIDDGRMQAALDPLAEHLESAAGEARDAALLVDPDGMVRVQPSRSGRTLDRPAGATMIRERLQVLGAGQLRLPTAEIPPSVAEQDLNEPRTMLERLLAQPLRVEAAGESIDIGRRELAGLISIRKEPVDGRARISIHLLKGESARLLEPLAARAYRPPRHGRFSWQDGALTLFESGQDGYELDLDQAALELEKHALSQPGPVRLTPRPLPPIGQAEIGQLGIRELISDAVIPIEPAPAWLRSNVQRAVTAIHGHLVMPGQTFSFLEAVGGLDPQHGYQPPPGEKEILTAAESGVTLLSTALLQAVFWSGYTVEERYAHEQWLVRAGVPPRGQPGLDAAVDPALGRDLRFTNSSDEPLLVQAGLGSDALVVNLYGARPGWLVQVNEPEIDSRIAPDGDPLRREDPTLPAGQEIWLSEPSDGFTVRILRSVQSPREAQPRTLSLTSSYRPNRGMLLIGTGPTE